MNTVNSIGLITQFSDKFFDKVYKQDSVTSILDTTDERVKFIGAKTVKIAKMQFGGLSNYYRNNAEAGSAPAGTQFYGSAGFGYQQSNAKMQWETFTLSQDRAASFPIEYFDDEESGGLLVGNAVTEISRTIIVPEIDAYALSTLAANAGKQATTEGGITSANALSALNDAFLYFEEHEVPAADQVIYVSPAFMKALRESTQITRFIEPAPGEKKVSYKITEYEGRTLITVPPTRFRTDYKAYDGGYGFGPNSKLINFLAVSKSAVIHIKKYEKVKIVSGDLNLAANGFDGYTVYARVYHDVFVPDNKKVGIYANVAENTSTSDLPAKLTVTNDKLKIASIEIEPANNQVAFAVKTSQTGTINVGDKLDPAKVDLIHVGDTFSAGATKFYAISGNYTVLAVTTVTFAN